MLLSVDQLQLILFLITSSIIQLILGMDIRMRVCRIIMDIMAIMGTPTIMTHTIEEGATTHIKSHTVS